MLRKENIQSKDERGLYDRDLCIKNIVSSSEFWDEFSGLCH